MKKLKPQTLLSLMCVVSCANSPPSQDKSTVTVPIQQTDSDFGVISGRVLLDGRPMQLFGVILARNFAAPLPLGITEFHSNDGTFRLGHIKPGVWDIALVGPVFARHNILQVKVSKGSTNELGDINVSEGFVVDGHVFDETGRPINRALVSITQSASNEQSSRQADSTLQERAKGTFSTRSNVRGEFSISGVTSVDLSNGKWRVFAVSPVSPTKEMSLPQWLSSGNHTITLVTLPTGTVSGAVERLVDGIVVARPVAAPERLLSAMVSEENYSLELPIGDYVLWVVSRNGGYASQSINVEPRIPKRIDFLQQRTVPPQGTSTHPSP